MWKRFQGHGREKERQAQIGNPVLLETTYDEDQLRRNPNIADAQNTPSHTHATDVQPVSFINAQDPARYRMSEVPSVSSMYSRPSQDMTYHGNPTALSQQPYEDISPPSSPGLEPSQVEASNQPRRYRSMRDVSPIDENRGKAAGITRPASNIPVLRKAPASIQTGETQAPQKFWGGKVAPNAKVKWDEYSGEPSKVGRAGAISPGSYAQLAAAQRPKMGYQVSVSGPEKKAESFTERVGRFATRSPPPVEPVKQPWKGASGRTEIAPPLKDQQSTKPLQMPRKPLSPTAESTSVPRKAPATPTNRVSVSADTAPVSDARHESTTHDDPIKPTVPLKVGRNAPQRNSATPTSPNYPTGLGFKALSPTTTETRRSQTPDTVIHEQALPRPLPAQQRATTPPQDRGVDGAINPTPEKDKQGSASRFSWTTYNSATTYQHSPPPSPPPALPQSIPHNTRDLANSILSKRRPVAQTKLPTETPPPRKPMSDSPGTATIHTMPFSSSYDPPSPSAMSTYSTATTGTYKALPAPPTTLSASDHIAVLESQMEDLRIRRSNVYRLLNDLNNAAPPNPLITDFRRARLAEQRKRTFEDELDEIKREEHDVGLKLHRAWRKREREDPNQAGSAIWVRRVTS